MYMEALCVDLPACDTKAYYTQGTHLSPPNLLSLLPLPVMISTSPLFSPLFPQVSIQMDSVPLTT